MGPQYQSLRLNLNLVSGDGRIQGVQRGPRGGWWILQCLRPGSNSALQMAESSFLCASSDGMLWSLAKCTLEGEWTTGNIWQKTVKMPETQTAETDTPIFSDMHSWPTNPQLKTQQHRKVSLREGSQIQGKRL